MRQDVKELLDQTFREIAGGARTLDPVTEIDIVLKSNGFRIVKINPPRARPQMCLED